MSHVHIVGIGGIGVSAIARYYREVLGWRVTGSDASDFSFRSRLESEGIEVRIGHTADLISRDTTLVIFSEAIITKPDLSYDENIDAIPELKRAKELQVESISYPQALARIFNALSGIAITGSHGKSTTTALSGVMLANSSSPSSVIVGTQVPQFGDSNFFSSPKSPYLTIEACEYKRSFLQYTPYITIITNIDLDHLDYYRDFPDYLAAFQSLVDLTSGYVIISGDDANSQLLSIPEEKKIQVYSDRIVYSAPTQETLENGETHNHLTPREMVIPPLNLLIPGDHIYQDACLAYTLGRLLQCDEATLVAGLESYRGSWRRSEVVGTTTSGNIVLSDYGHHPKEIIPTLRALKGHYSPRSLFVVFQPHQYSRTRELLADFAQCFDDADELMIPDIYFSRDKQEDVLYMTLDRFVSTLRPRYPQVIQGTGLEETARYLEYIDQLHPGKYAFLLLGAGNIDSLREYFSYRSDDLGEK